MKNGWNLFVSPERCASKAAGEFVRRRWRWKNRGDRSYIPTRADILGTLLMLKKDCEESTFHPTTVRTGRLIYTEGLFGYQRGKDWKYEE